MEKYTEIVFILDRSGSMSGLESDTIGGFNGMLTKQKKESGKALVSTILFDDRTEVLHDRIDMELIEPMTDKDYYVRGCTALLDAVGGAIQHIQTIHKYAREEDRPDKTMFIIITDGMENASRRFHYNDVKAMLEQQKKEHGWEFLFLGANIDSVRVASRFGISPEYAADYHCDSEGTALNYDVISDTLCQVRAKKELNPSWKSRITEDYQKRERRRK